MREREREREERERERDLKRDGEEKGRRGKQSICLTVVVVGPSEWKDIVCQD